MNKAIALMKKIAANNPEFHKGHSQLAELLSAGQAAACFTCYSQHFPARIQKGCSAELYADRRRCVDRRHGGIQERTPSEHGPVVRPLDIQPGGTKNHGSGGRTPAHPKVEPVKKTRTEKIYPISVADIKEYPKYEKIWKDIFKLR